VSGVATCKPFADPAGRMQRTTPVYRCAKYKPCVQRRRDPVDGLVGEVVVQLLSREEAHLLLTDGSAASLRAAERASLLRVRRAQVVDEFDAEGGSVADLLKITKRLDAEIVEEAALVAKSTRPAALQAMVAASDASAFWAALPLGPRREVVRALLEVTVLPSGRSGAKFHPELIRIEMKT